MDRQSTTIGRLAERQRCALAALAAGARALPDEDTETPRGFAEELATAFDTSARCPSCVGDDFASRAARTAEDLAADLQAARDALAHLGEAGEGVASRLRLLLWELVQSADIHAQHWAALSASFASLADPADWHEHKVG